MSRLDWEIKQVFLRKDGRVRVAYNMPAATFVDESPGKVFQVLLDAFRNKDDRRALRTCMEDLIAKIVACCEESAVLLQCGTLLERIDVHVGAHLTLQHTEEASPKVGDMVGPYTKMSGGSHPSVSGEPPGKGSPGLDLG